MEFLGVRGGTRTISIVLVVTSLEARIYMIEKRGANVDSKIQIRLVIEILNISFIYIIIIYIYQSNISLGCVLCHRFYQ